MEKDANCIEYFREPGINLNEINVLKFTAVKDDFTIKQPSEFYFDAERFSDKFKWIEKHETKMTWWVINGSPTDEEQLEKFNQWFEIAYEKFKKEGKIETRRYSF